MVRGLRSLFLVAALLALQGCERNPLRIVRSPCPAAAVPHHVGHVTLFQPADSRDSTAIDLVAQIDSLRARCAEGAERLVTELDWRVTARRRDASSARTVDLPMFLAVVQGGNVLVSKELTAVRLEFAPGQQVAETRGRASSELARTATSLPPEIQQQITRRRRPNDPDALVDPLADPAVRAAVRAASFELLVGFQLTDAQLAYNIAG